MAYLIDTLTKTRRSIGGYWWIARPDVPPIATRILDALRVLRGQADAVVFRENLDKLDDDVADLLGLENTTKQGVPQ